MDDKIWQGADLIFDLDGDHLPGVTDRDFPAMLEVSVLKCRDEFTLGNGTVAHPIQQIESNFT